MIQIDCVCTRVCARSRLSSRAAVVALVLARVAVLQRSRCRYCEAQCLDCRGLRSLHCTRWSRRPQKWRQLFWLSLSACMLRPGPLETAQDCSSRCAATVSNAAVCHADVSDTRCWCRHAAGTTIDTSSHASAEVASVSERVSECE